MNKKQKIYNDIKEKILSEQYIGGERLMSEISMSKFYNVSHLTVRNALNDLLIEGLIEKRPGSGTYVKDNYLKKYNILMPVYKDSLLSDSITMNYIINKIKELCKERNYKFHIVYLNKMDALNVNTGEISGIINTVSRTKLNVFTNTKIPVVSLLNTVCYEYPGAVFDYRSFYKYIGNLIEKYEFKKPIMFCFNYMIREKTLETYAQIGFYEHLKKYHKVKLYQFNPGETKLEKKIDRYFSKLDYEPDLIIFSDDVIYKKINDLYPKYSNILSKAKIITCINKQDNYKDFYNVCKLELDLEEKVTKGFDLLEKLMKNEFVGKTNIFIKPKILNEEALTQ